VIYEGSFEGSININSLSHFEVILIDVYLLLLICDHHTNTSNIFVIEFEIYPNNHFEEILFSHIYTNKRNIFLSEI
jgi:hypothetical protein